MRRAVLRALLRRPSALARIGAWSVLEAAPAFLVGHAVARALEDGFAAGRPVVGLGWLAALGGAWLVSALGARQVVLGVAAVVEPFRDDLLAEVVGGALGRDTDRGTVARAGLQVELARDALAALVTTVRGFAFTVISVTLGLLTLAPRAVLLVLPPYAVGVAFFLASLRLLARRQRAFLAADERLAGTMTELAGGLRDITAWGAEDRAAGRAERAVEEQAGAARALARVTSARTAALAVGGWLPVVLLLAGTPWLLRTGSSPAVVVGALTYVTQSLGPALGGLIQGLGVSGVRLAAVLDRILLPRPVAAPPYLRPSGCSLELRGVGFAYGEHAEPVVDGLDLTLREGEHLAVVGPSGSGKSTLAALMSGLLSPDAGTVTIGGAAADRVDPAARVLIPQEAYVFRGTLRENLAYYGDASPERMEAAMRELGLEHAAPDIDPAALSPGQRQLVALVRAYLAPAGLVILDEATCHLDPAAEARVEEAFARRGGTLVVVAHRLSSAARADRVLFTGDRWRTGTHDELVRTEPGYAELFAHWHPEPVS